MKDNIRYCGKDHWLALWHRLGTFPDGQIIAAYSDILIQYSQPHRKYHNLEHISHCLAEFQAVRHLALDIDALELAIWYHDAIYEIGASDNEERSAILAQVVMNSFDLPTGLIDKVKAIIIATKHEKVPDDHDAKLMLDIDISNLGQADKFKESNRLVREEYSSVPANLFANGRSNILQSFLDRPSIYLTEFFQQKYEDSARKNIESAIKALNE